MNILAENIQKNLSGNRIMGNIFGAGFGVLTQFCACSTIPMTVGFLNAEVPLGSIMSSLISSPLLNSIIIGILGALVGLVAVIYFIIAFICSVAFGVTLQKMGGQKHVKKQRLSRAIAELLHR